MPAEVAGRLLTRARIHLFPRSRTSRREAPEAARSPHSPTTPEPAQRGARLPMPQGRPSAELAAVGLHPPRQVLKGHDHGRQRLLHLLPCVQHNNEHDRRVASMVTRAPQSQTPSQYPSPLDSLSGAASATAPWLPKLQWSWPATRSTVFLAGSKKVSVVTDVQRRCNQHHKLLHWAYFFCYNHIIFAGTTSIFCSNQLWILL